MIAKFVNPANDYEETVLTTSSPIWFLLVGPLYLAYKGIWNHFVVAFCLVVPTLGISWLVYPFFTNNIIIKHYQRMGWKRAEKDDFLAAKPVLNRGGGISV